MTSPNDVPAEIRQNSKRFFEALVAPDMRGIHALDTKDSKVLASGSKPVRRSPLHYRWQSFGYDNGR